MEDRTRTLDDEKEDERSWRQELQDVIGVLITQIYMYMYVHVHVQKMYICNVEHIYVHVVVTHFVFAYMSAKVQTACKLAELPCNFAYVHVYTAHVHCKCILLISIRF